MALNKSGTLSAVGGCIIVANGYNVNDGVIYWKWSKALFFIRESIKSRVEDSGKKGKALEPTRSKDS
jgi:hypothetical protein